MVKKETILTDLFNIYFKIIFFVLSINICSLSAQNLAPNPDFEIQDASKGIFNKVKDWNHILKNNVGAHYWNVGTKDISSTAYGKSIVYSGTGCWGMFLYPISEMIEAKLLEPLKKDSIYKVSLYVSLGERWCFSAVYGFPVFFSDSNITKIKYKLLKPIYLTKDNNFPLTNKETWEQVFCYYKAKGNEQYIHIGSYDQQDIISVNNLYELPLTKQQKKSIKWGYDRGNYAYYYIDNVLVEMTNSKDVKIIERNTRSESDTIQKVLESGFILWNGYTLTWEDFKGQVPLKYKESDEGAGASLKLIYNKTLDKKNNIPFIEIKAYFIRTESFVKKEAKTNIILKHEQIHFDIAELYARLFRKEIKETVFNDINNAIKSVSKMYKHYLKDLIIFQNLYDKETSHSTNLQKQIEWNEKIEKQLKELEQYSKSKIDVKIK